MTYSWQPVVEQLYHHLGVHPTRFRMTQENCQILSTVLHRLCQSPHIPIEHDLATAIGLLAANIALLPPSHVTALSSLKGPIRLLIFQAAREIGASTPLIYAIHRTTWTFFSVLETQFTTGNVSLPPLRSQPLAGFHASAWQDARTQGWMLQYLAYTLCVHRHLINKCKKMENSPKPFGLRKTLNNLYGDCVGARYLLPRLPRPAAPAPKEPGLADLVSTIVTISTESNSRRKRLLIRRARQFVQLLDATREIRPANRSICTTQSHSRPIPSELRRSHAAYHDNRQPPSGISASEMVLACDSDDAATVEDAPVITRTRRVWVAPTNLNDALLEGESVWDYAAELLEVRHPQEDPQQAFWQRQWQRQRAIMDGQESTFAARTLQPNHFAEVYRSVFAPVEDGSDQDRLIQAVIELFFTLLTLYGCNPINLEDARLGIEPSECGILYFDVQTSAMTYRIPKESVTWRERPPDLPPEYFIAGSDVVRIPLLPIIGRLLNRVVRLRLEFGLTDFHLFAIAQGRTLRVDTIDKVLRQPCGRRVSCRRLSRSTLAWLRHHGAPHVVRSLVSGKVLPASRGTLFYTNVNESVLVSSHLSAVRPFVAAIREAMLAQGDAVPAILATEEFANPTFAATLRIGSHIVPDITHAKACFEKLRARIGIPSPDAPLLELIESFDRFAVYVALATLWLTGCRPWADSFPAQPITGPSSWTFVAGKGNRTFPSEGRPIPLCQTALALLTEFHEVCRWLIRLFALRGKALTSGDYVFFVDPTGNSTLPVNGSNLRRILQGLGLYSTYPYPLNTHRHLWVSRALEESLLEIFDPFLGHLHVGTEPWGRFSLANLEAEAERFRSFAERMASDVGIVPVSHPLRGWK